jgi:serine/threonine protein kinase
MGTVYAARDPDLDRAVAVKVLHASSLGGAARREVAARLLREAKAMARLSHPDVITVHDVGAVGEQLFIAMEYVDGGTLRGWRAEAHRSVREILAAYERAGSGLAAAHDAGLVHRDFKPDNVLVGRDGRVRVTDFGLARTVEGSSILHGAPNAGVDVRTLPAVGRADASDEVVADASATLTRTGTLLGTPAYMAPEQLRGRPADRRSDVFAFCVSLYEALYGERPFAGVNLAELEAAIGAGAVREAPIVTRVPAWVRTQLLRGLRAAPEQRFDSMRQLLDALRAGQARSRHRRAIGFVCGLAVLGAGVALHVRIPLARALQPAAEREAPVAAPAAPSQGTTLTAGRVVDATSAGPTEGRERTQTPTPIVASPALFDKPSPPSSPVKLAPGSRLAPTRATAASVPATPASRPASPVVGNNGALILE